METFTFTAATSYEGLSPITQAYGVCVDSESNVLLQKYGDRPWNIPGGRPEPGETYEETVIREVYEETTVVVERPQLLGYQEIWENGQIKGYQLRYLAFITRVDTLAIDPDTGFMRERLFVPLKDVMQYIPYPQYADLFNAAQQALNIRA